MKILMIIRKLGYSGAYKMFMWLAKALADSGLDVTVCTWANNDVETLPDNIKWIKLDLDGKGFFTVSRAIRKIVKEVNADVSISFLLDGNVYNTIGCMGRRTKSVICERNDPFKPGYYKLKFWKPLFRFADGAVFQLPKVAEYYNNVKGVTAVIPNPVFCKRVEPIKSFQERENVIVTLGRLDIFQKRHDLLIEAFSIFHLKNPTYKLEIYGDGTDEGKLIEIAKERGISNAVVFAGVTNDPVNVLAKSKIFVLSSDFEGIPNALIEAMAVGLPCVSTDCRPGGARLLIQNNINGIIVPPNSAQKIADAMIRMASDAEFSDKLGNEAVKISDLYSEITITKEWIHFLNQFK